VKVLPFILLAPFACGGRLMAVPATASIILSCGLGRVKIGITVKQAAAALGTPLKLDAAPFGSDACGRAARADGHDPWLSLMFEDRRLTRIDINLTPARSR
jgi:hypothetical protein